MARVDEASTGPSRVQERRTNRLRHHGPPRRFLQPIRLHQIKIDRNELFQASDDGQFASKHHPAPSQLAQVGNNQKNPQELHPSMCLDDPGYGHAAHFAVPHVTIVRPFGLEGGELVFLHRFTIRADRHEVAHLRDRIVFRAEGCGTGVGHVACSWYAWGEGDGADSD